MQNDSYLIEHLACPQCIKQGRDNGRDNLGVYSDGHCFCFSCSYHINGNRLTAYQSNTQTTHDNPIKTLYLPSDADTSLPTYTRDWLQQYEFDQATITSNLILWSPKTERLIFPYFIKGELVGYQARCFNKDEKEKRKWFSQGKLDSFIYTRGNESNTLILVESIISTIKVSHYTQCSPIFGSIISLQRFITISHFWPNVVIWLDPDKRKEAVQQGEKARSVISNVSIILSDKKPKDHSYEDIRYILNQHTRSSY
jgi:hypothetical protein